MPSHTHEFPGDDQLADAFGLTRNSALYNWDWTSERDGGNPNGWYNTRATGGNQPHNIMMPYMAVHWIMKI
ncbi:MAG: hypothetical protein H6Q70_107 [Firmicutes bacterium]|nr:hypothetical protein [Bacillota bacterium]